MLVMIMLSETGSSSIFKRYAKSLTFDYMSGHVICGFPSEGIPLLLENVFGRFVFAFENFVELVPFLYLTGSSLYVIKVVRLP